MRKLVWVVMLTALVAQAEASPKRSFRQRAVRARRAMAGKLIGGLITVASKLTAPLAINRLGKVRLAKDVRYGATQSADHRLDIYQPPGIKPGEKRPVVVYYPGGGFTSLSKETHRGIALRFARQGYVVFVASYRKAAKHPFPAAVTDAADAYAWVAANAKAYGGDVGKLVVAGESAGANLALGVALGASGSNSDPLMSKVRASGVVPKAVLPACGLLQVSNPSRLVNDKQRMIVRDRIMGITDAYLPQAEAAGNRAFGLADPLLLVERSGRRANLPPMFIGVGSKDPIKSDSSRLHSALQRLGVATKYRVYDGGGHAFQALPTKLADKFWKDTFDFLKPILK